MRIWLLLVVLSCPGLVWSQPGSGLPVADDGLGYALASALLNHPSIQGKNAEVLAQSYLVRSARQQRLPSLTTHANNLNETRDQGNVALDIPLLTFGRIGADIRLQKERLSAERVDLTKVERDLLEQTALQYAAVLTARDQLANARASSAAHEELHDFLSRRAAGRLAAEADLVVSRSRLYRARADEQRYTVGLQTALTDLHSSTGVTVPALRPVEFSLFHTLPSNPGAFVELVMENSIEVQAKRQAVVVARADVTKARKVLMPTLSFRVEDEFLDDSLVNIDQSRVGFVLHSTLPGLGFAARSRAQGAAAGLSAARHDLAYTRQEAQRRARLLTQEYALYVQLEDTYRQAVQALEDAVASVRRQYNAGRASWLEILNMQRELDQQRQEVTRMSHERISARLRMYGQVGYLHGLHGGYAQMDDGHG